jgi:GTPase involved in cell partitioning and DNA repair
LEQPKELSFIIEGLDLENTPEEEVRKIFNEKLKKYGYQLIDETAVIRANKISSMRGLDINNHEEVEMYVFAKQLPQNKVFFSIKIL